MNNTDSRVQELIREQQEIARRIEAEQERFAAIHRANKENYERKLRAIREAQNAS